MSKARQIRELWAKHPSATSVEIARALGCTDAYVRAVKQRGPTGGTRSDAQKRYDKSETRRRARNERFRERYWADPAYRAYRKGLHKKRGAHV